ncbi:MAG: ATP-binding protein [Acidovorax sp.]|nr:ATP-binding protein [Acidovorax sp.]
MYIKKFSVAGLNGDKRLIEISPHRDMNIITGRNGSGKTTILKLMWYAISGNLALALQEVDFERFLLVTDLYEVEVWNGPNPKGELREDGKTYFYSDESQPHFDDSDELSFSSDLDDLGRELAGGGSSIFFPTFRRIEGGFSIAASRGLIGRIRTKNELEDALMALSQKLSNGDHQFVASLSTADIVRLLMRHYTNLTDNYSQVQASTTQQVIGDIKKYQRKDDYVGPSSLNEPNDLLEKIKNKIEWMEAERDVVLRPINAVQELVARLFAHSGIKIDGRLNFGDAATAVSSDKLSAGEKQLLSFICYNAFAKDAIVIIDEPELSLHVDWQRQLFPILQGQGSSNQFIVATHSPFIYSKYPEKELMMDSDRGDGGYK